ncbi:MAG: IS21 family transposase [Lachnospiraceae bacterium]|nr:IS21 family transposase [Lachnospiraceae bacterium]
MIIESNIITDLRIESIQDLYKLKPFVEEGILKVNKSQIGRELGIDRRTVDKYINGFEKSKTRKCDNCITPYYDIIKDLLDPGNPQIFYYKSILWQYLVDNHNYSGSYVNFCLYLKTYDEFESYFKRRRPSNVNQVTIRYETGMGKQAQLDWKEKIEFLLNNGETVIINVFVLLLSYSRFRVYRLSISKTQEVLFNFLDGAFEVFGGVPQEIVTDNMSTVMDVARTENFGGKVNSKFQQFADDYGFKVRPCIAGRPRTKAKVEAPMKILDEIRAYNGKLDYDGLNKLVTRINNRVNTHVVKDTGIIPIMYFNKEKAFLSHLPVKNIRKPYQITTKPLNVNSSSMINYGGNQYSVPTEYLGKSLIAQAYDGYIHLYYNTKLVTVHKISEQKLNYHEKDYIEIARKSHSFKEEDIESRAKENLALLGGISSHEYNISAT